MTYLAKIEALLFVAGDEGLSLRQLAELLELTPTALNQQLDALGNRYKESTETALMLIETANRFRLVTKPELSNVLKSYAKTPMNQSLSRASLEVLSIIAYKQPITRVDIDVIRGVNSSGAISKLLVYGLIAEAGTKDVIGRPKLYQTTPEFLDFMGINQLSELLDVESLNSEESEINLFVENELEEQNENQ